MIVYPDLHEGNHYYSVDNHEFILPIEIFHPLILAICFLNFSHYNRHRYQLGSFPGSRLHPEVHVLIRNREEPPSSLAISAMKIHVSCFKKTIRLTGVDNFHLTNIICDCHSTTFLIHQECQEETGCG